MKKLWQRLMLIASVLTIFTLQGCKPESMDIEVYTSDLRDVSTGKLVTAPTVVTFSMLGEDKKNILDEVVAEIKDILPKETKVSISQGRMGKQIVIETLMPISTDDGIKAKTFAYLLLTKEKDGMAKLSLHPGDQLSEINKKISRINMMLSADLPAAKSNITIRNDAREDFTVSATAVFIAKKPHLTYAETISKRGNVTFEFKGGSASIYSEIPPQLHITNIYEKQSSAPVPSGTAPAQAQAEPAVAAPQAVAAATQATTVATEPARAATQAAAASPRPASPAKSFGPSFDCAKARSYSEKMVCNNALLGRLDGALAENYRNARQSQLSADQKSELTASQRAWFKDKNKCSNEQCLEDVYRSRIDRICLVYRTQANGDFDCNDSRDIS